LEAAIILSRSVQGRQRTFTLLFESDRLTFLGTTSPGAPNDPSAEPIYRQQPGLNLPWRLSSPDGVSMPPLAWSRPEGKSLEIAGVSDSGAMGWALLNLFAQEPAVLASQQVGADPPFLAATLLPSSIVAGVLPQGISCYAVV